MKYLKAFENKLSESICYDCGKKGEVYFLKDDLWNKFIPKSKHIICLKCLEKRLGRKLKKSDFKNSDIHNYQSWWKDIEDGFDIDDYVHTYTESTLFIIKDIKDFGKNKRYKLHYGNPDLQDIFHKWVFVEEIYLAEPYEVSVIKYNI